MLFLFCRDVGCSRVVPSRCSSSVWACVIEALFGNASVCVFCSRNFSVPTLADPVSRGTVGEVVLGKGDFPEVETCQLLYAGGLSSPKMCVGGRSDMMPSSGLIIEVAACTVMSPVNRMPHKQPCLWLARFSSFSTMVSVVTLATSSSPWENACCDREGLFLCGCTSTGA